MEGMGEMNGFWSGDVDISRTPSPGVPAKRMRMTLDEIRDDYLNEMLFREDDFSNLMRAQCTPESLGYDNTTSWRTLWFSPSASSQRSQNRKKKMQTGCIPCLYVVITSNCVTVSSDGKQCERHTLRSEQS
jgi:hypothetical protein